MTIVVVNGLFVGAIYGLLAVGLVVVYRGSRLVNFAYGETGMVGAFAFVELVGNGLAVPVALAVGVAVSGALGAATEVAVVRPLRDEPRITPMVGTLAVAALLLAWASRRYGLTARYVEPLVDGSGVDVLGVHVSPGQLLIAAVSAACLAALGFVQRRTSFGLRLRATALDPVAAGLSGVNTTTTSLATWTLAGALAGLSAILVAPLVASFTVFFMTSLLLRSVAAALIGGMTSIGGAFVAALALGVLEGVIAYVSPVTGIVEVVLAVGIITVLLVRPDGLVRSAY